LTVFSACAEFEGDLFVETPETIVLSTSRSRGVSTASRCSIDFNSSPVRRARPVFLYGATDGDQQVFVVDRFGQEVDCPAFMACTLVGILPWPVRKTTDRLAAGLASVFCRSMPFSPGMATSSTTQPGMEESCFSRNSCGIEVETSNPDARQQAR